MGASLKLAELLGSLSYALDITEGQPEGHCVRSCWIGMHIGRAIGLEPVPVPCPPHVRCIDDLTAAERALLDEHDIEMLEEEDEEQQVEDSDSYSDDDVA